VVFVTWAAKTAMWAKSERSQAAMDKKIERLKKTDKATATLLRFVATMLLAGGCLKLFARVAKDTEAITDHLVLAIWLMGSLFVMGLCFAAIAVSLLFHMVNVLAPPGGRVEKMWPRVGVFVLGVALTVAAVGTWTAALRYWQIDNLHVSKTCAARAEKAKVSREVSPTIPRPPAKSRIGEILAGQEDG
jgi:hypothetical protein